MAEREFFRYEHPDLAREGKTFYREKPKVLTPKPTPMVRIGEVLLPDEDGPRSNVKKENRKD